MVAANRGLPGDGAAKTGGRSTENTTNKKTSKKHLENED